MTDSALVNSNPKTTTPTLQYRPQPQVVVVAAAQPAPPPVASASVPRLLARRRAGPTKLRRCCRCFSLTCGCCGLCELIGRLLVWAINSKHFPKWLLARSTWTFVTLIWALSYLYFPHSPKETLAYNLYDVWERFVNVFAIPLAVGGLQFFFSSTRQCGDACIEWCCAVRWCHNACTCCNCCGLCKTCCDPDYEAPEVQTDPECDTSDGRLVPPPSGLVPPPVTYWQAVPLNNAQKPTATQMNQINETYWRIAAARKKPVPGSRPRE